MRTFIKPRWILVAGLVAFIASASAENISSFAGKDSMEGYKFSDFSGFETQWKLVTVRYRQDTGEMRFTYANEAAWKALQSGAVKYPDGAVFGKVGVKTDADPAFPSSAVPAGARRYQFMVRDAKGHKDTDGWGYALFDQEGKTFPEDPKTQVIACAACHRLVPQRGFVFSQLMNLAKGPLKSAPQALANEFIGGARFVNVRRTSLPEDVRKHIDASIPEISLFQGELTKSVIQGTLDEIRPSLTRQVIVFGRPALFLSDDKKDFSLVYEETNNATCKPKRTFRAVYSLNKSPSTTNTLQFCDAD